MSAVRTSFGAMLIAILGILSPVSAAPSSITIPDNIRQHVPADAFLLVYTPSAEKLVDALSKTAESIDPQAAMQLKMMPMMGGMMLFHSDDPGKQVQLDLSAPAALAMSQGTGTEPSMTVIIGVQGDHTGIKPAQPGMRISSIAGSSLVVMTNVPEGPALEAGASLLQNIPPGDISIAFDQALFYKQFGPMIDMMMAQMGGGMHLDPQAQDDPGIRMMQAQGERSAAQLKMFMEMFKSWDLAMTFEGANVASTIRWIPTDPKLKASGSADLGEYSDVLVDGSPLAMVMSHSALKMMMDWQQDYEDMGMPPGFGDAMNIMMTHARKMMKNMEGSVGVSYGLDSKGIWCLQLFKVKNKAAYLSETDAMFTELNEANLGIDVSSLKLVQPGVGYTVRIDMEQMFSKMGMAGMIPPKEMAMISAVVDAALGGEVGMQIRYLSEGNNMAVICGRNGQVIGSARQILKSSDTGKPNALDALVSKAQGSPTGVLTMDFRKLFGDALGFIHSVPALQSELADVPSGTPAGDPIRLDATCTAMAKGGQCVVTLDVGGFVKMMEAMDDAVRAKKRDQAALTN